MDQIKIGRFIAERRRLQGLTQAQLAQKLNITDRAVSKWETGRSLPDATLMLALCEILGISVNELLSGEKVTMEKFYVRLYEYDSGEFRVTVMDPKNATRYSVVYINEDEVPDNVNFSETTAKAE